MSSFSEAEVIDLVRTQVQCHGSMRALAREWDVSPSYLFDLLEGRRAPGPKILGPLGLERVKTVVYRERQS